MRTILVTGGCGFIGSNFIKMLLREENIRIVNIDKFTYSGRKENIQECLNNDKHVLINGDICNTALIIKLLTKYSIEGIINFAAESHVDRSLYAANVFVETNVQGTVSLLQATQKANIRRFLQVSTDEVYGSLGPMGSFSENSPLCPNSPYSASKTAADHFVHAWHHSFGLDTIITRCSNNYGPNQFPEKMIPLMFMNALNDKPLPVYGDGLQVRDWIYVNDHCRAIWLAYENGKSGEVYNIGANCERTNLLVIHQILTYLNKPHTLIQYVKDRPGHDRRYAIDSTKANMELKWYPEFKFEEGLKLTLDWYMNNKEWITSVTSLPKYGNKLF